MITTVTTVTSIAAATVTATATISIAAVAILILFLIAKELTGASQSLPSQLSSRFLDVGILPLVMVFAVVVVVRIIEILA